MRCLSRQGHSSFVDKCISVRQSLSVDACRGAERVALPDMNAEDFQSLSDEEKFACCSTQVANISDRSLACSFHTARINAATTFCGNAYHMHTSVRLSHWYGIGFTSGCWYGKHDLRQFVFVFCLSSVPIPRRMKRKCAVADRGSGARCAVRPDPRPISVGCKPGRCFRAPCQKDGRKVRHWVQRLFQY